MPTFIVGIPTPLGNHGSAATCGRTISSLSDEIHYEVNYSVSFMVFADFCYYFTIQFVSQTDTTLPPCACDHVCTIPCDDQPGYKKNTFMGNDNLFHIRSTSGSRFSEDVVE